MKIFKKLHIIFREGKTCISKVKCVQSLLPLLWNQVIETNGFAMKTLFFKNVLHEINLMGLEFINLTKRGQAKERKKTLNAKLHQSDIEH